MEFLLLAASFLPYCTHLVSGIDWSFNILESSWWTSALGRATGRQEQAEPGILASQLSPVHKTVLLQLNSLLLIIPQGHISMKELSCSLFLGRDVSSPVACLQCDGWLPSALKVSHSLQDRWLPPLKPVKSHLCLAPDQGRKTYKPSHPVLLFCCCWCCG